MSLLVYEVELAFFYDLRFQIFLKRVLRLVFFVIIHHLFLNGSTLEKSNNKLNISKIYILLSKSSAIYDKKN